MLIAYPSMLSKLLNQEEREDLSLQSSSNETSIFSVIDVTKKGLSWPECG
jgi:hypothetical protein